MSPGSWVTLFIPSYTSLPVLTTESIALQFFIAVTPCPELSSIAYGTFCTLILCLLFMGNSWMFYGNHMGVDVFLNPVTGA